MGLIPRSRPQLPPEDVRKIVAAKVPSPRHRVTVLGIRGYYEDSLGKPGQNDRGLYDDAAFVVLNDRVVSFNFNTDPSAWRNGIATLVPGVWRFVVGWHKLGQASGHAAFRQDGLFTVRRDGKGTETGSFGINLHRGGNAGTSSLGCQTVPPDQWAEFRDLIYSALGVKLNIIKVSTAFLQGATVQYILVDKAEAEKIIGRSI